MMSDYPQPVQRLRFDPLPPVFLKQQRYWPMATLTLIALCIIVYILMTLAGGSKDTSVLLEFGASYAPYLRRGDLWRLVMPMFLHIGWFHLAVNMGALYLLGPILERIYGYARFSVIYVGAGIAGSWLSMRMTQNVAAGASGAIMGIAGAMLVVGWLYRELVPWRWKRAFGWGMAVLIAINYAIGLSMPNVIDNWGHTGGLAGGMALALLVPPPLPWRDSKWIMARLPKAVVVLPIAIVALAMFATTEHYRGTQQVTRLLDQGRQLWAQHQDARAAELFQQAASQYPDDERPYEALAALYLSRDQFGDAISKYNQALSLSPGSPAAQLGLAAAYARQGRPDKARQQLEAVVGQEPRTAEVQLMLADLCAEQKLFPEAIQHYQKAIWLKPDFATARNNLAWLLATADETRYRNPAEALAEAQQAVDLSHWKEPTFIDTLAEALYVSGQYQQAVAIQKKALALDPGDKAMQEHMAKYQKAAGT
ncbi:MAG TPA: rhomboid family intramembrane serine protease [Terriglobia bacterium]|nr:rhomboid family intramembrane serine protease [Terriglobia bacterium]